MDQAMADFVEKEAVLVSRVDYPVLVAYGTGHIRVSPRTITKPLTHRLLGTVPAGITVVQR